MIFTISFFIAFYIMKIIFSGEGIGQEHFPRNKPFIVVFNHNSNFDILTLPLVAKFKGIGMGKYELFNVPILNWWLRKINVYPIIRGSSDTEGFEKIKNRLNEGEILFISPEGTRKWSNGESPRPKLGFVRLAQAVGCPIVPVAITGTRDILPPGAKLPRWRKIVVKVGKPVNLIPIEMKQENREILQQQANEVMYHVYKLLPDWARPKSPVFETVKNQKKSLLLPYKMV